MTHPDLVQFAERSEIIAAPVQEGIPEAMARQLGRAGGEVRLVDQVRDTAMFLVDEYIDVNPGESTDNLLLQHYPGIVSAFVQDPTKRAKVLELWTEKGGQRDMLQALVDHRASR